MLQYGLKVLKPEGTDEKTTEYIGKRYTEMFGDGFLQDVHIWLNKAPVQNPLLCEEDGPVYQLRRWYEQFYVDKADVDAGDDRALRVRGRHHQGQRVLARPRSPRTCAKKAAEDEAAEAEARPRRRPAGSDGLVRPDQRGDAGGPASLHPGAPDRGGVPGLPGQGAA